MPGRRGGTSERLGLLEGAGPAGRGGDLCRGTGMPRRRRGARMASSCPFSPGVARKREGFAREWAGSVPTGRGQVKKRSEGAGERGEREQSRLTP